MRPASLEVIASEPAATARRLAVLFEPFERAIRFEARASQGPPGALNRQGVAHLCIQSRSIDEQASRLQEAGFAPLAAPTDLGGDIRYQYARDADGLIVELESVPDPVRSEAAWLAHIAFASSDCERLAGFYAQLTGGAMRTGRRLGPWAKIDQLTGFIGAEVSGAWVACREVELEFWTYHVPGTFERPADARGFGTIDFACDDVAAERCRVIGLGITLDDEDGGVDPDGNRFRLIAA